MDIKEILNKGKGSFTSKLNQFKELSIVKKIAVFVAVVALVTSIIFGVKYLNDSKYTVLFSGLDNNDAATITKELESQGVDMKIKGESIYVPKDQVDKLRLELSGNISNGSKGFEMMDEGSSFGLTDEEFKIKKQRMVQGEIEKTIKTFDQVESARVHLINGEESVFSEESQPGSAAVSLTIKPGYSLEPEQVRSIMSLVSASSDNIPKQNVEVVDQNMNLLSEGLYDENGNIQSTSSSGLQIARKAEKELNSDLERAISSLLVPMFGQGKVVVKVNTDLNFDSNEITEIKIDPERVAIKENKKTNTSTENGNTGGSVDNNMNSVGGNDDNSNRSEEESIEYETGKTESKTIKAQGEINRITASVAIDGTLDNNTRANIENIVADAIGFNADRGDSVSVVDMKFGSLTGNDEVENENGVSNAMTMIGYTVGAVLLVVFGILIYIYIKKKKENDTDNELIDESEQLDMINQKIQEMEQTRSTEDGEEESITLEEEVRTFASENKEQVTDLIKTWLDE